MTAAEKRDRRLATAKAWKLANPDKCRAYQRKWNAENAERLVITKKAWLEANQDKVKRQAAARGLIRRYGITIEQRDAMFAAQGGLCAIRGCEKPAMHVDHDHDANKVREGLCVGCNTFVGRVETNPDLYNAVIEYLEKHKCT